MVKSDRIGTFLYRSIVEAHPDIVGIPVMPSIEQRIGVIWKKGNTRMLRLKNVIKFIKISNKKREQLQIIYCYNGRFCICSLFIYSSQSLIAPGGQTSSTGSTMSAFTLIDHRRLFVYVNVNAPDMP